MLKISEAGPTCCGGRETCFVHLRFLKPVMLALVQNTSEAGPDFLWRLRNLLVNLRRVETLTLAHVLKIQRSWPRLDVAAAKAASPAGGA